MISAANSQNITQSSKNIVNLSYKENLTKIINFPFADVDRTKYIITEDRYQMEDRDVLKATLLRAADRSPGYLIFCDSGNREFWTYDIIKIRKRAAYYSAALKIIIDRVVFWRSLI